MNLFLIYIRDHGHVIGHMKTIDRVTIVIVTIYFANHPPPPPYKILISRDKPSFDLIWRLRCAAGAKYKILGAPQARNINFKVQISKNIHSRCSLATLKEAISSKNFPGPTGPG